MTKTTSVWKKEMTCLLGSGWNWGRLSNGTLTIDVVFALCEYSFNCERGEVICGTVMWYWFKITGYPFYKISVLGVKLGVDLTYVWRHKLVFKCHCIRKKWEQFFWIRVCKGYTEDRNLFQSCGFFVIL